MVQQDSITNRATAPTNIFLSFLSFVCFFFFFFVVVVVDWAQNTKLLTSLLLLTTTTKKWALLDDFGHPDGSCCAREVRAGNCKGLSGWWVLACRPPCLSPGHVSPPHSPRALTGPSASSDVALMRSTGGTGHHSRMKINGGLRHRGFRPDFSGGQFACVRLPRPGAGTL